MFNIKNFLNQVTSRPGIYQFLGKDHQILYIGKARNLKKRLSSYFSAKYKDHKTAALVRHIQDIQVIITRNENEALLLECNLIKKHQPHYNILFRDDKSYPYILIAQEGPYPYIDFYRGRQKTKGTYFGPYPNAAAVRETIYLIQKLFGLRVASDHYNPKKTRPCLQYQMGLCSGACAGLISKEDYQRDLEHATLFLQGKNDLVLERLQQQMEKFANALQFEKAAELRNQITKLREIRARQYISIQQGEVDVIVATLSGNYCVQLLMIRGGRVLGSRAYFPDVPSGDKLQDVLASFLTQHYLRSEANQGLFPKEIVLSVALPEQDWFENAFSELAGHKVVISWNVRGEKKKWLEMTLASAKQSLMGYLLKKTTIQQRFLALEDFLAFDHSIKRIECFDISHTAGESTVASCVVFGREGPQKADYRRFNIIHVTPGDDVAAMQQALLRRFQKLQNERAMLPDLILIDGGKPQLNAAKTVFDEFNIHSVRLVAVAKGPLRKPGLETLLLPGQPPLHLPNDSPALHFIQQIRDEAHRFAILGHRQKRAKHRKSSTLENIPGVGTKRRRELLRYFGGIQAINRASLDELAKVPGISRPLAERIFSAFHDARVP